MALLAARGRRRRTIMDMSRSKKVLVPIDKGNKETFWFRIGTAYTNKDGSTNIYLDALPATTKLQVRDFDEKDLAARARRDAERGGGAGGATHAADPAF
jgi:hypothetical protein